MADEPLLDSRVDGETFITEDPLVVEREVRRRASVRVVVILATVYVCVVVTMGILKTISLSYQTQKVAEQSLQVTEQVHAQADDLKSLVQYTKDFGSVETNREYLSTALSHAVENSDCLTREALQELADALKESGSLRKDFPPIKCPVHDDGGS